MDEEERRPPPPPASSGPAPPTPVRKLMGQEEEEAPPAPESRAVEVGDETWHVQVGGRQKAGTSPDSGASLLLLLFRKSPDEELPRREVYVPARELDDIDDEDFPDLLSRSRPYQPPDERRERDRPERARRPRSRRDR
jgi:hypothetical protein